MARRIVFGYEEPDWTTTTGSCMEATKDSVRQHGPEHFTEKVNPDNKTVHWGFGTERLEYTTSNGLPDPRTSGNAVVKVNRGEELKKTNFVLGYEKPDYQRGTGPSFDEMAHHTARFIEENKKVKRTATSNITWGYENSVAQSQAQSAFVNPGTDSVSRKQEKRRIKEFVDTLKTTAVTFGVEPASYSTSSQLPGHDVTKRPPPGLLSTKQAQQKTNIVFGYD
ncbi:Hypothetical Protein FCC1311_101642 [Hondaea fermentalgiana]|uniref:Uncharacterized protein n=1 Tax=Hondaea fermentalgiana TaxID=2315210 RepID=A0A2R5GZN4_9STRA|nr:Hypothetical Protein FCC1311_101642 [Hondaea fermentalgiana]|eukprot:GBG33941.1 Hypothetical Protein FCC1311_101642 [Hondaea fermentalgiana]